MARRLEGGRLVIASHNHGKVREIRELLVSRRIEITSAAELFVPEPTEDGESFAANAAIKARAVSQATGLPALSDDSGLVVPALGGEPGIHSARWAGPARDFNLAMEKVITALDSRDAAAHFICALALAWPDGHLEIFEGRIDGTLVWPPRGGHGFGYDPIFVPISHQETFGEMTPEKKHAMSHRARAFALFADACLPP
ncbi:MAG: RdgB/HAM1 family non-canonical purine NTP pyrophosphatase [Alphaproteobacteria bacterium]